MYDELKFLSILVFAIPSIIISIFIFAYFITHPVDRSKPKNHVWFVLLICSFLQIIFNLPMPMSFYYYGKVWPATDAYCVWWTWCQYTSCAMSLILMGWASLERHIFVFYPGLLLGVWWKKWVCHLGPILSCILWPPFCYIILVVIKPNCVNQWNYDFTVCGVPCFSYINDGIYGVLNLILHVVIPITTILFSNIALLTRIIYEKISRRQAMHWRRQRKMAFQLWFISSLYLACWVPVTLAQIIRFTINPSFMNDQLALFYFLIYFVPLLLPIICLGAFPEVTKYIRTIIRRQRIVQIMPIEILTRRFQTAT